MAGIAITTDMEPKKALRLARDVARDLAFTVNMVDEWAFSATKGNLALSIFLGAFIAYCDFEVEVQEGKYESEVDIVITRNSPWWTGAIGVHRVKTRAKELATHIADAIEDDGCRVIKEREF